MLPPEPPERGPVSPSPPASVCASEILPLPGRGTMEPFCRRLSFWLLAVGTVQRRGPTCPRASGLFGSCRVLLGCPVALEGQLGCLQLLPLRDKVAVNAHVQFAMRTRPLFHLAGARRTGCWVVGWSAGSTPREAAHLFCSGCAGPCSPRCSDGQLGSFVIVLTLMQGFQLHGSKNSRW